MLWRMMQVIIMLRSTSSSSIRAAPLIIPPTSLQDTETSFHVFPVTFLKGSKAFFLLGLGIQNCFHECRPSRINFIGKVVHTRVYGIVDLVRNLGGMTSQYILEHRGLTKDIEVILRFGNSEECMPNPTIK
ncbi:unnamed protein product [Prunus armeniaca]